MHREYQQKGVDHFLPFWPDQNLQIQKWTGRVSLLYFKPITSRFKHTFKMIAFEMDSEQIADCLQQWPFTAPLSSTPSNRP